MLPDNFVFVCQNHFIRNVAWLYVWIFEWSCFDSIKARITCRLGWPCCYILKNVKASFVSSLVLHQPLTIKNIVKWALDAIWLQFIWIFVVQVMKSILKLLLTSSSEQEQYRWKWSVCYIDAIKIVCSESNSIINILIIWLIQRSFQLLTLHCVLGLQFK